MVIKHSASASDHQPVFTANEIKSLPKEAIEKLYEKISEFAGKETTLVREKGRTYDKYINAVIANIFASCRNRNAGKQPWEIHKKMLYIMATVNEKHKEIFERRQNSMIDKDREWLNRIIPEYIRLHSGKGVKGALSKISYNYNALFTKDGIIETTQQNIAQTFTQMKMDFGPEPISITYDGKMPRRTEDDDVDRPAGRTNVRPGKIQEARKIGRNK